MHDNLYNNTPTLQEPVLQQVACANNNANLHTIIKELREQNAILLKTISTLTANKENT